MVVLRDGGLPGGVVPGVYDIVGGGGGCSHVSEAKP